MPSRSVAASRSEAPRLSVSVAAVLIVIATFVAYLPAMRGGFIWDDDAHVTKQTLQSVEGLYRIWFDVGATQQYYPLLHTAFWVQHKLWGDSPVGYHIVNVLLHSLAAVLVLLILRRLLSEKGVPWATEGAVIAAAVFALHPVHVESVAWITEQKNTLSAVFYLSAMLTYLRFDRTRLAKLYTAATLFFVLGLLTKTVIATLPAALLVIFWWLRGRFSWKRDVIPLLPWFVLGAAGGLLTAWVEHDLIGAKGQAFELGFVQRLLLAGRIVWFYLYKLIWPTDLIFIYPRWTIDATDVRQWLYPATLLSLLVGLWFTARRSRAPLAAMLFFVGSLFPVLGFFNVYPFLFAFVADHFQYLPSLGIIALLCSITASKAGRVSSVPARMGLLLILPAILGALTFRQCKSYADAPTLYRATLAKNPDCWMAYNNLGVILKRDGKLEEAISNYRRSLELRPDYPEALSNLGLALSLTGRQDDAIATLQRALVLRPAYPEAMGNLSSAWLKAGRAADAAAILERAIQLDPDDARLHANLGSALESLGRIPQALDAFRRSLALDPNLSVVQGRIDALSRRGPSANQTFEAIQQKLKANPDDAAAHYLLAQMLAQRGRTAEAITHYRETLRIDPSHFEARNNLATLHARAGDLTQAIAQFQEAVRLRPDSIETRMNLAVAYSSAGRLKEAQASAQKARELARSSGRTDLLAGIETWIETYMNNSATSKSGA